MGAANDLLESLEDAFEIFIVWIKGKKYIPKKWFCRRFLGIKGGGRYDGSRSYPYGKGCWGYNCWSDLNSSWPERLPCDAFTKSGPCLRSVLQLLPCWCLWPRPTTTNYRSVWQLACLQLFSNIISWQ